MNISILAYGSLIDDPGEDLAPLIAGRRSGVMTPFPVEFAHASVNRGGGPTLTTVTQGGAPVQAELLLLRTGTSLEEARNFLYARETGRPGSRARYIPDACKPNQVYVEVLECFQGEDRVLYARTNPNIAPLTAENLARRAIESVAGWAGDLQRDGICYLVMAKQHGIATPLMADYERKILEFTAAVDLWGARRQARHWRMAAGV